MTDYRKILDYFYPENDKLRKILVTHSKGVTQLALQVADRHQELNADIDTIEAGAMLHDIGIKYCDAPGICCLGIEHYIRHGILGAAMLRNNAEKLSISTEEAEILARICERHTGTGLTVQQIITQNLPLPHINLVPETIEEKIICYADKFFSKTHPERQKSYEEALRSLRKFGEEGLEIFTEWHKQFG